mmetsp:Transcript_3663/g.6569  ORF Transcript_3663/g.6569 Transcript_3663/m.6569 type:complete len:327 (-) Transcript_3663:157-1137(-)
MDMAFIVAPAGSVTKHIAATNISTPIHTTSFLQLTTRRSNLSHFLPFKPAASNTHFQFGFRFHYHTCTVALTMAALKIDISKDIPELATKIADYIATWSAKSIQERGAFNIALSGGSLPKTIATELVNPNNKYKDSIQWAKWNVFFADERIVPWDHDDSNYKLAKDTFLKYVPVDENRVFKINEQCLKDPVGCAKDYESQLVGSKVTGSGFMQDGGKKMVFDMILLGMGPDGHCASLFPGHKLLNETSRFVADITDSPKPPPCRVTLTYPVINDARSVAFVVTGDNKKEMIKRILKDKDASIPSQRVQPTKGELIWYIDTPAAVLL